MVTFGGIVQMLWGLQLSDSVDIINSSLATLCELETHGFDAGSVRACLTELALLKSKAGLCEIRRKEVESELEKSSNEKCLRPPGNSPAQAMVVTKSGGSRTRTTADYQKDWPFIKLDSIWATLEALELYQTPPQKPHFSPLKKMKEEIREGTAIDHMVTFGGIVQRLWGLQQSDSVDIIDSSLATLCELETHEFDVGSVRSRLTELALLKSKAGPCEIWRKKLESELEKTSNEKCGVDKELDQLQVDMHVLKEKTEQLVVVQKA